MFLYCQNNTSLHAITGQGYIKNDGKHYQVFSILYYIQILNNKSYM